MVVLSTTACVTTPARERIPDEYHSDKSPKELAVCISNAWDNSKNGISSNVKEIENGYTVQWQNVAMGHIALLADITTSGNGSRTRYYKNMVWGTSNLDRLLVECH